MCRSLAPSSPEPVDPGLLAATIAYPLRCCFVVVCFQPFIVDLALLCYQYAPLLIGGGRQPDSSMDVAVGVLILPAILALILLLQDVVAAVAAVAAKWILLGRLQEGRSEMNNLVLLRFEICYLLTDDAGKCLGAYGQSFLLNIFMKAGRWPETS